MTNINIGKIAFFVSELHGGGAQRVVLNLAKEFAERGIEVDLILARAEGVYLSQIPSNVRLVDLKAPRLIASFPALVKYLKIQKPKILISALQGANLLAIWARSFSRVETRLIITVHNTLSHESKNYVHFRYKLIPYLMRYFYTWADNIVAVSKGGAKSLVDTINLPSEIIKVVYNPIFTPEISEKAKEIVNNPWLSQEQPPVILGVGRLNKQKDFPNMIHAFAKVRAVRKVRLVILGEGEERESLETLIQDLELDDEVSLPGFIENPYAYMAKAAVFVLSSAYEGFGNVLVEAMACGTTVVSTNCESGPAEILEGGKYGKLVPIGDSDALADAILSALDTPFPPQMLRSRAEEFSVDKIYDRYLEVISSSGNGDYLK